LSERHPNYLDTLKRMLFVLISLNRHREAFEMLRKMMKVSILDATNKGHH